ncbi:hypothetical protein [Paenibacillus sp. BIC5C1]|uniref:hypothetical protein n=1 Tax=Paenibacillus sp. BIC5C1 TaxID=3078263 RepID=UPI0028EC2FD2|nr:hypothetical protein [Paenibacillus sp. BIC5C1]
MKKKSRANSGPQPDPPAEAPAPRVSLAFIKQVNEVTSKVAFKLPSEHSEGNKPLKSQGERCSEEGRNRSRGSGASAFGAGFPLLRGNEKEIPSQPSGPQPDPPSKRLPRELALLLLSELTK